MVAASIIFPGLIEITQPHSGCFALSPRLQFVIASSPVRGSYRLKTKSGRLVVIKLVQPAVIAEQKGEFEC
jgi:hypothetical protein